MEMMKKKWWHDKILYEIYPKSFCDSDGDGIGDLGGILQKLDYLQGLGVDILWICPCFRSPFVDQGYDVSDYYQIDPVFGTNAQMEELLAQAKKRNMSVILDLVANHCSAEHFWFRQACHDPEGKYGSYFYIRDAGEEDLPTNWRSYFGGPVWSPLPGNPGKKYLHVFHEKQPDLNWENPEVRSEMFRMMTWWVKRGVRGFRVDAIMNIKKELPLHDYLPDREDGLCNMESILAQTRGIETFLKEMKEQVLDPYDLFTVAEVVGEREQELPMFIGEDGFFSSMFDFKEITIGQSTRGWYDYGPITPEQYRSACFAAQSVFNPCGFQTNVIENHDGPRGVNRFLPTEGVHPAGKKMLGTLFFFLRGIPCIYQGQEIGMENIPLDSPEQIDDVSALSEYGVAIRAGLTEQEALSAVARLNRDNARTPMQWEDSPGCGFTAGTPWMRANPNSGQINVAQQEQDPDSVLAYYKEMIALRKREELRDTFVYGSLVPVDTGVPDVMAYRRVGERDLLVVGSFSAGERTVQLPARLRRVLLNNLQTVHVSSSLKLTLQGWQALVLELEPGTAP